MIPCSIGIGAPAQPISIVCRRRRAGRPRVRPAARRGSTGLERADVLFGIVSTEQADTESLVDLCAGALAEASGDDARSARILAFRSGALLRTGAGVRAALSDARESLERAERAGEPWLVAAAISRLGIAEAWTGESTPGLLERGVEIERRAGLEPAYYDSPRYALSRQLARAGDTDGARALLEQLEGEAAARGDEASRGQLVWWLSLLEWLVGRWERALEHANVAYELAQQTQYAHARVWVGRARR